MANYSTITDVVAHYVRDAMPRWGLAGWTLQDLTADGDYSSDDTLSLVDPDGTRSPVYIQSGPFGICVSTEVYDDRGELEAVEHQSVRQKASVLLIRDLVRALRDAPGPIPLPAPAMMM